MTTSQKKWGSWYHVAERVDYSLPSTISCTAEEVYIDNLLDELIGRDVAFKQQLEQNEKLRGAFIRRVKCQNKEISESVEAFQWDEHHNTIRRALLNRGLLDIVQKERLRRNIKFISSPSARKEALIKVNKSLYRTTGMLCFWKAKSPNIYKMKRKVWASYLKKIRLDEQGPNVIE